MLGILLKKEWKEHLRYQIKKNFANPLTAIVNILILGLLMVALLYLFIALNKRFALYDVADSIFILTVFGIIILQMVFHLNRFANVLFEPVDNAIIAYLPISKTTLTWSKIILFYFEELFQLFMILTPIIIAYGITNEVSISFYFLIIPITLILPIFVVALSLILVYPFYLLRNFLKNQYLIQLILIVLIIGLGAFIYRDVLELFIGLIGENRLSYLFNTENAELLTKLARYAIPCNWIINFSKKPLEYFLLICLMICLCGGIIYGLSCVRYRNFMLPKDRSLQKRIHKNKLLKPTSALIKKEYLLIFRSSNQLFSYGGLLILLPVFVGIITSTLKPLVVRLLSENFFFPFVVLIVTVFACIVNSFGGFLLSREGKCFPILKLIPVSYKKQISIKFLIAFGNALVSLLLTMLVLIIMSTITIADGMILFLISSLLVGILILLLIKKDLANPFSIRTEQHFISAILFSIFIPLVLFILVFGIFIIELPHIMLFSIVVILGLTFVLMINNLYRNIGQKFKEMGV